MSLRRLINRTLRPIGYELALTRDNPVFPGDFSPKELEIIEGSRRYTMAKTVDRIFHIVNAARYVSEHHLAGAIVECGVWRGGMMVGAARTLLDLGDTSRDLYLFNTFEGMAAPTEK